MCDIMPGVESLPVFEGTVSLLVNNLGMCLASVKLWG